MIRLALVLIFLAALAVAGAAVLGEPGHASFQWLGWRLDMTAVAALMLLLLGALAALLFWRTFVWILQAPRRAARARAESRRRHGAEALTRGFLAAAAGDGSEARRCAVRAADLVEDTPALVRVLAAQAAEASGDSTAAEAAYTAMLGFPEMRLAGHRGLMQLALARGDEAGALAHAEAAYAMGKTARWAWRAVVEARLKAGDWAAALDLVKGALDRKIVSPLLAERTRAALLTASASSLESSADAKARGVAREQALEAVKLRPDFAPAAVVAARLLKAEDKIARASSVLESAWKEAPHPALWLAYRDLHTDETPRERADRLSHLAGLNPDDRESRFVSVEAALLSGDPLRARALARPLADEPATARLCGLMARAANAAGESDEARAWIARAAAAPQEADWSDLDPEGDAFDYRSDDWARLVASYGERGELVHPRLERHEKVISELPELPGGYQASAPFLRAAESGGASAPLPDDPGAFDDDGAEPEPASSPGRGRGPGS